MAEAYVRAIHRGVYAIAQKWAPEIENWMRSNASWTDRTANARQTLHSEAEQVVGQMVTVVLAHGMDYGFYLEGWNPVRNAPMLRPPRYQIIEPALDYFGPLIWRDVVAMLS